MSKRRKRPATMQRSLAAENARLRARISQLEAALAATNENMRTLAALYDSLQALMTRQREHLEGGLVMHDLRGRFWRSRHDWIVREISRHG